MCSVVGVSIHGIWNALRTQFNIIVNYREIEMFLEISLEGGMSGCLAVGGSSWRSLSVAWLELEPPVR